MQDQKKLIKLRKEINENIRVQKHQNSIEYIDVGAASEDVLAKQNHAIFARRGCGKTLLLHHASNNLEEDARAIYLNCEDFKHHSFPNVLIEILISLLGELKTNTTGWFGKKAKTKKILSEIIDALLEVKENPDAIDAEVKSEEQKNKKITVESEVSANKKTASLRSLFGFSKESMKNLEKQYQEKTRKVDGLNLKLPEIKTKMKEFFESSSKVKCIFIQIDDLYHLKRADQPFVVDYIHRLCKDLPLYFKIATLRHNSSLYIDSIGQPIGAQERHDYQPIDIDYNFSNFKRTENQNRMIIYEFGKRADMSENEIDNLFKGEGFSRLVMAGGGVPRDVLSLFLQALIDVGSEDDPRIGKDNVRTLSRSTFERRIEELKEDSKEEEQGELLKGIYFIKQFCLKKQSNIFLIEEKDLQQDSDFRALVYRLMDYRIIHNCANALTHKSSNGTFQAFAIDIGSYAHLRKFQGKLKELDVSSKHLKDKMRSSPILSLTEITQKEENIPGNIEAAILDYEQETS